MTNDELKKKIAQIIADYFCPQRNEHKNLWGDDRLCYSKMNFAGCERVAECTDALIAAGIGDVKEAEHRAKVAEKALKHAVNSYIVHWETASKKRWWYKYFFREAEKELAELKGDGQ